MPTQAQVRQAAEQIAGNMPENKDPQFSPVIVAILIQVIATFISEYGPRLLSWIKTKLGVCARMRVKRMIREKCSADEYRQFGRSLYDAVLTTWPTFTEEQVRAMVNEVVR